MSSNLDDSNNSIEFINLVADKYSHLTSIWIQHGFTEDALDRRRNAVLRHTMELFHEMITEEERRLVEKKEELAEYQKEIEKLCKDLEQTCPPVLSTTLIKQCEELLKVQIELKERKKEKMKEWIQLKHEEKRLRESLGETVSANFEDFDGIPGNDNIKNLQTHLLELAQEKERRAKEIGKIKLSVKSMLANLEKPPMTTIEMALIEDNVTIIISLDFLEKSREVVKRLGIEVESNRAEVEKLRVQIDDLKRRLQDEPQAHGISLPDGFKPSVLALVRAEYDRIHSLKMTNLSRFIERVRVEIEQLSEEVFKKPLMPELIQPTEESMDLHEHILESLKAYQVEHKKLLELWSKRQSQWSQRLEYEAKADDPNRLNNRGGTLLKEEKIRKGLEKSLPKLEKEIVALAKENPTFKIFGEDVSDIIEEDWTNFNREKEDKKIAKKLQTGTNNTMNVTRKRPMTPGGSSTPAGKRGKLMIATPVKLALTPKRALRSSSSKDNLPPSPTYSEFTSYKQIFQSTMNDPLALPSSTKPATKSTPTKSTPTKSRILSHQPKLTPREIKDKF